MAKVRWKGDAVFVVIVLLGGPLLVFMGGHDHSTRALQCTLANTALAIPIAFVATALVELVVVAIVRALGDRVTLVIVGFGPIVFTKEFQWLRLTIALLPTASDSWILTRRPHRQRRRIAIARFGAAVVTGAIFIALVLTGGGVRDVVTQQITPLPLLGLIGVLPALSSMLRKHTPEHTQKMLGLGLVQASVEQQKRGAYETAERLAREGLQILPENELLQLAVAESRSRRADVEALAIVTKLRSSENPIIRAAAANGFAWQAYLHGTESLRAEAESAMAEALTLKVTPMFEAALRDTRGHVALWSKRYADAERDLLASYSTRGREGSGRMSSAAGLAMVYAATNRPGEAREWLAKARAEGIEHDLLARATAAVEPLSRS